MAIEKDVLIRLGVEKTSGFGAQISAAQNSMRGMAGFASLIGHNISAAIPGLGNFVNIATSAKMTFAQMKVSSAALVKDGRTSAAAFLPIVGTVSLIAMAAGQVYGWIKGWADEAKRAREEMNRAISEMGTKKAVENIKTLAAAYRGDMARPEEAMQGFYKATVLAAERAQTGAAIESAAFAKMGIKVAGRDPAQIMIDTFSALAEIKAPSERLKAGMELFDEQTAKRISAEAPALAEAGRLARKGYMLDRLFGTIQEEGMLSAFTEKKYLYGVTPEERAGTYAYTGTALGRQMESRRGRLKQQWGESAIAGDPENIQFRGGKMEIRVDLSADAKKLFVLQGEKAMEKATRNSAAGAR